MPSETQSQMPHPVDVGIFPQARGRSDHAWCRVHFLATVGYEGCQMPHPVDVGTFPQVRGRSDRAWCRIQLPRNGRVGYSGHWSKSGPRHRAVWKKFLLRPLVSTAVRTQNFVRLRRALISMCLSDRPPRFLISPKESGHISPANF